MPRTLISIEKQVTARDSRWFTVRVMPYRTQDNRVDGVVITLTDISACCQSAPSRPRYASAQSDLEARFTHQAGRRPHRSRARSRKTACRLPLPPSRPKPADARALWTLGAGRPALPKIPEKSASPRGTPPPKGEAAEASGWKAAAQSQRLLHELRVHQIELEMQNGGAARVARRGGERAEALHGPV